MRVRSLFAILALAVTVGCAHTLAPGGAYNPTGATPNNPLYVADGLYKIAFTAVDGVFAFEAANRELLAKLSPKITPAIDQAKTVAKDIDHRWAAARAAYIANPGPDTLKSVNDIVAEFQALERTATAAIAAKGN